MNVEKLGYSVEKAKKKNPNKHFPMAQVKIFKARLKKNLCFYKQKSNYRLNKCCQ